MFQRMSINRFCAGWDLYPTISGGEQATEHDREIYDEGLTEESSRLFFSDGDNVDVLRLGQNRTVLASLTSLTPN